jgi:hypothetical protein
VGMYVKEDTHLKIYPRLKEVQAAPSAAVK